MTATASIILTSAVDDAYALSAGDAISDQWTDKPVPFSSKIAGRAYDLDVIVEVGFHTIKIRVGVMKAKMWIVAIDAPDDPDTALATRPAMRPGDRATLIATAQIAILFEKTDTHTARCLTCILCHTLEINRTWLFYSKLHFTKRTHSQMGVCSSMFTSTTIGRGTLPPFRAAWIR